MSIPNLLSIFRILLIPVFILVFAFAPKDQYFWLAIILAVSGLTDVLDGFIARKFHQVTSLGKVLDPIADKLTVAAVLTCLVFLYPHVLFVLCIYVGKELLMLVGALIFTKEKVTLHSARWFGKLATAVTYIVMLLLIIIPNLSDTWVIVLNSAVVCVTLFSLVMYALEFLRTMKKKKG